MLVLVSAEFESGIQGATLTTGDPANGTAFSDATINAPATMIYDRNAPGGHFSPLAVKITPGAGGSDFLNWNAAIPATSYSHFYFWPSTFSTGLGRIWNLSQAFVAQLGTISVDGSGILNLNDTTGTTHGTASVPLLLNGPNRLEITFVANAVTGNILVNLYRGSNVNGTTPDDTIDSGLINTFGATGDSTQLGILDAPGTGSFWFDSYQLNNTALPGPVTGTLSNLDFTNFPAPNPRRI